MLSGYYKLDPVTHKVLLCENEREIDWSLEARQVDRTSVGPFWVSTVFLVLQHGSGNLFETRTSGPGGDFFDRYATWDEAVAGHARAVATAQNWWKAMPDYDPDDDDGSDERKRKPRRKKKIAALPEEIDGTARKFRGEV